MKDHSDTIHWLGIEAHIRAEIIDALPDVESSYDPQEPFDFEADDHEQLEPWVRRTLAAGEAGLGNPDEDS